MNCWYLNEFEKGVEYSFDVIDLLKCDRANLSDEKKEVNRNTLFRFNDQNIKLLPYSRAVLDFDPRIVYELNGSEGRDPKEQIEDLKEIKGIRVERIDVIHDNPWTVLKEIRDAKIPRRIPITVEIPWYHTAKEFVIAVDGMHNGVKRVKGLKIYSDFATNTKKSTIYTVDICINIDKLVSLTKDQTDIEELCDEIAEIYKQIEKKCKYHFNYEAFQALWVQVAGAINDSKKLGYDIYPVYRD